MQADLNKSIARNSSTNHGSDKDDRPQNTSNTSSSRLHSDSSNYQV